MEVQSPSTTVDSAQLDLFQRIIGLDTKIRSGINWFFWIGGLSLINTFGNMLGSDFVFFIGLGMTQFVAGFMAALARELPKAGNLIWVIGFAISAGIAGVFSLFGVFGRKHYRTPVIIGMVLYTLDAVLLLLFEDILSCGFHVLALIGIWNGLKAMAELEKLKEVASPEAIEKIRQQFLNSQPGETVQQHRKRLITRTIIIVIMILAMIAVQVLLRS
jgi:hypothetical protein